METVKLGQSPFHIPRIALGGVPFGREIDEQTSWMILDYALDHGINLIDTAEAYGGGNAKLGRKLSLGVDDEREVSDEMHSSEKIIGRWLQAKNCRDRVQICTKFSTGGQRDQVLQSLQASMKRLQTDYIDIYMLHRPFPDVPLRETLETLSEEVRAGRIRTLGCSNFPAATFQEAQAVTSEYGLERLNSVQPPFSLADTRAQSDLLPYCQKNEIATMTYSPLAAGFLTGKYAVGQEFPKGTRFDISPAHADLYFNEQNFSIIQNLRDFSHETDISMPRLAMSWVLQRPDVSSVLVGARTTAHLDNAIQAIKQPLNDNLIQRMNSWLRA